MHTGLMNPLVSVDFRQIFLVVGDAIDAGWYQPGHGMALAARGI